MTYVICRLTAKNLDQLRNPTLSNRVWATFLLELRNKTGAFFRLEPGSGAWSIALQLTMSWVVCVSTPRSRSRATLISWRGLCSRSYHTTPASCSVQRRRTAKTSLSSSADSCQRQLSRLVSWHTHASPLPSLFPYLSPSLLIFSFENRPAPLPDRVL